VTSGETSRQMLMETASLWQARLDSGTADPAEFEAWRAADPRHAAAFARIAATLHQIERAKRAHPALRPSVPSAVSRRGFLAAGGGLMAAGLAGVVFLPTLARARARTGVGDHRRLSPANGLSLDINTNSSVSWATGRSPQVWLEQGELALTVATGAPPCRLSGGNGHLSVVSGTLNARLRGETLDLMVLDGDCVIIPERTPVSQTRREGVAGRPLTVSTGHALMATGSAVRLRTVSDGDISFTGGWRNGEMILDGQSLGAAVDEYNRYLTQRIIIADPQLESLRLGGRFSTHSPDDFLQSLSAAFGVHVQHDQSGDIILTK